MGSDVPNKDSNGVIFNPTIPNTIRENQATNLLRLNHLQRHVPGQPPQVYDHDLD